MYHSRIFFPVALAGWFAAAGVAQATVQDFGNLRKEPRTGTATTFLCAKHDAILSATGIRVAVNHGNNQFGGAGCNSPAEDERAKTDSYRSSKQTANSIPVPEPEIYAMVMTGLGLIGFTARRRNRDV